MWLILSDSHDNILKLKKIVEIVKERRITHIFHLGDIVSPFTAPYLLIDNVEFLGIFGNNDGEKLLLVQKFQNKLHVGPYEKQIGDYRLFLMHEPYALRPAIKSQLYDFVFYGHTHQLDVRTEGKTLVVNPGEACGYLTDKATVIILNPWNKEYEIVEI